MIAFPTHLRPRDFAMKLATAAFACTLLALALVGCGSQDRATIGNSVLKGIELGDDRISLHGGRDVAVITKQGDLSIGGKAVALNPAQRSQAQRLYANAVGVRDDGIAIGKAGAAIAGKAVSETIEGMVKGDPGAVGDKMDAEANNIAQQAQRLCKRVVEMRAAQDALVETLPAFKPFATLDRGSVTDCNA